MVTLDVDVNQFQASIKQLASKSVKAARFSALDIGFEILRLSQMEVPHDTGYLQDTGVVEEMGDNVVVGYHTPYAARLHEHPEYKFQKGRKGKFLEDPIVRNSKILGITFGKKFEGSI